MKIKELFIYLFSFILTSIFLLEIKDFIVEKRDILIEVKISNEKKIKGQIFYTERLKDNFNEKESFRKDIEASEKFQNIVFDLKNVEKLEKLRIDFGEYPQLIKIKEIKIIGKKEIIISVDQILKFSANQLDSKEIKNGELYIYSNQADPFIILDSNLIQNESKINLDVLLLISIGIVSFIGISRSFLYFSDKKLSDIAYMVVFFLVILFPVLKIDKETIDFKENRKLAVKPQIIENNNLNLNYGKNFEKWLNDHFYKRSKIIKFYDKINNLLTGRIENNRAFLGKDNWLFYKGDNSIENFQNKNLYSIEDLEKIKNNIQKRKEWLEKQKIKYYIIIAPDKNKIYGEFYPKYINKISNIGKAQQLKEYLSSNELILVYPDRELFSAKNKSLLYWKTDTHWNEYGGLIGYTSLVSEIQKDFPDIEIISENKLDFREETRTIGDLLNMLSIENKQYENVYYMVPHLKLRKFVYEKNEGVKGVITKSEKKYKVLVFRDSFTEAMLPYLSETFGEVEYIWNHNFNSYQDKIREYKPDIVIHEMVERYIDVLKIDTPKLEGEL